MRSLALSLIVPLVSASPGHGVQYGSVWLGVRCVLWRVRKSLPERRGTERNHPPPALAQDKQCLLSLTHVSERLQGPCMRV